MRLGKMRLLGYTAAFLFVGLGCGTLSLFYLEPSFCTSSERGWPLGIVVYPCLCYGLGDVEWFVSAPGLIVDTLLYGMLACVLAGLPRLLAGPPSPRRGRKTIADGVSHG
jgi:hypothetical protein